MQVNDQVKVVNAELETNGQAGVVHAVRTNKKGEVLVDVKLDIAEGLTEYQEADLQFLGR